MTAILSASNACYLVCFYIIRIYRKDTCCNLIWCLNTVSGSQCLWCSTHTSTLTLVYMWCCYGGENRYWVHLNIASSQCHSGCAYEQIKQSNGPNGNKSCNVFFNSCGNLMKKTELHRNTDSCKGNHMIKKNTFQD